MPPTKSGSTMATVMTLVRNMLTGNSPFAYQVLALRPAPFSEAATCSLVRPKRRSLC